LLNGAAWIDAVASTIPENNSSKIFAAPVSEGWAAIGNPVTGDRLEVLSGSPVENNAFGIVAHARWLARSSPFRHRADECK